MEDTSENRPFRRTETSLWPVIYGLIQGTRPLDSDCFIYTMEIGQTIASIIVLALSLNKILKAQLKSWIVVSVTLLLLYLGYRLWMHASNTRVRNMVNRRHIFCFSFALASSIQLWILSLDWWWMLFLLSNILLVLLSWFLECYAQSSEDLLDIHLLELLEDETPSRRGASTETIDALPKYKFKAKKSSEGKGRKDEWESSVEVGIMMAVGSKKERPVSAADAMCCICLGIYKNDVDLRELPCRHHFHVECVDGWLDRNASCPLCKREIGESSGAK